MYGARVAKIQYNSLRYVIPCKHFGNSMARIPKCMMAGHSGLCSIDTSGKRLVGEDPLKIPLDTQLKLIVESFRFSRAFKQLSRINIKGF